MSYHVIMLPFALAFLPLASAECASSELELEGLSFLATRAAQRLAPKAGHVKTRSNASDGGPYYDPVQDFIDSWEQNAASEYFVAFAKEATKALIEEIPVIGQIASLVLGVFFGASKDFSWVRPLVNMIQEWTKMYVDQKIFEVVESNIFAFLKNGNQTLIKYETRSKAMKENASAGLPINKVYAHDRYRELEQAADEGRRCMNYLVVKKKVFGDNYGRLLPLFLLCANFQMSTYGENIKLAQYLEEQWGYRPSWAVVSPATMQLVYDTVDGRMYGFLQSWDEWRRRLIGAHSNRWQEKQTDWRHNDFWLTDHWKDGKDDNLWSFSTYRRIYPDEPERALLRTIKERQWRSVQVKEKIPMLRPYAALHRLIPGNEKSIVRPQHMPDEIVLGPFSAWSTNFYGRWAPKAKRYNSLCRGRWPLVLRSWRPNKKVKDGKLKTIQVSSGKWLDQLVFESETTTFKLPKKSTGGDKGKKISVGTRCGISLLYSADKWDSDVGYMAELLLFRPDNTSTAWNGEAARKLERGKRLEWNWGQYSSGSGLCGLYQLWQVKRFAQYDCKYLREQSGDAIEFSFKWQPDW